MQGGDANSAVVSNLINVYIFIGTSLRSQPSGRSGICLTPFLAGFFDTLENLAILALMHYYDGKKVIRELALFGGMMTLCKWNSFVVLPLMIAFHELLWSPKDDELEFSEELEKKEEEQNSKKKKKKD